MTKKRLHKNDRKIIIQEKAKQVFLEKSFKMTTMQDIVNATGLSIGGLYYHYKNTTEILYDIMTEANKQRENIIYDKLNKYKGDISYSILSSIIVDKILSDNNNIPLYVILLQEMKENHRLTILYEQIKQESKNKVNIILSKTSDKIEISDELFDFLTNIINSFILGCELLDVRKDFLKKKDDIRNMIEVILKKYIKIKEN